MAKFEFEISWQDLAFIWCLVVWAWLFMASVTQQSILPFNFGLAYIYAISFVLSIPGVPAYVIWKWRKAKRERKV